MPSAREVPSIEAFRQAGLDALRGEIDASSDARVGSMYDVAAGMGAMLWSQQAQRDRDLFRAIYTDTADGDALSRLVEARLGAVRVLDTYGAGTAYLQRASAAGGAGTFWAGTRIVARRTNADPIAFAVLTDTPIAATATYAEVPVRRTVTGPGTACDLAAGLAVDDPVWDPSWTISRVTTADGTAFEIAADYRARARAERLLARRGRFEAIVRACRDAGAAQVVAIASDFWGAGYDDGLNTVFVGDAAFGTSDALKRDCLLALERVRVCGTATNVLGMVVGPLPISLTLTLWREVTALDRVAIEQVTKDAVAGYFRRAMNAFLFKRDAMTAAIQDALRAFGGAQSVAWAVPTSDVTRSNVQGIGALARWVPSSITVAIQGPS